MCGAVPAEVLVPNIELSKVTILPPCKCSPFTKYKLCVFLPLNCVFSIVEVFPTNTSSPDS